MKPKIRFDSSWDDGDVLDIKIVELLRKYNLPGTFYIPGLISDPAILEIYEGFDIGGHTVSHPPDLKMLNEDELLWEIHENKVGLETVTKKKVDKFCYPRGRYDQRAINILKSLGFKSARTTKVLKVDSVNPFETDTTIHVYQRNEYNGVDWVKMATEMLELIESQGGTFHIWGHSWEIERDQNWQKLNYFFEWLTSSYEIIKP